MTIDKKDNPAVYTRSMHDRLKEDKLWGEIRRMAKTHPTMKDLADQLIMTYHLIKDRK